MTLQVKQLVDVEVGGFCKGGSIFDLARDGDALIGHILWHEVVISLRPSQWLPLFRIYVFGIIVTIDTRCIGLSFGHCPPIM